MKNQFFTMLTISMLAFLGTSCNNDDDAAPTNLEESITKVVFTVTEAGTTNTTDYTWQTSGLVPSINLQKNKSYTTSVKFYNGSTNLTDEIVYEKDDHFIVYTSNLSNVTLMRNANDAVRSDAKKLGINTTITTGNISSNGEITIRLVHLPTTVSDSDGFGTATGGSTDANVSFLSSIL